MKKNFRIFLGRALLGLAVTTVLITVARMCVNNDVDLDGALPTGVPPTGAPPTGVPPTGVPPTDAPPTGAPPTGAPPIGVPPIGVPPIGVPPIGVPPIGVPPIGAPPIGAPPTGAPPTNDPPIGVPDNDSSSTMFSDSASISEPVPSLEEPELYMKYRVTIFNQTSKDLTITLGEDESSMVAIKIDPYRNYTSGSYSKNPTILIRTTGRRQAKTYRLILGGQYRIVWNGSQNCYDLE